MTARFLSLASAVFLLTACNSGDSFLEWDEETAAMLAAQEAAAEAAENPDVEGADEPPKLDAGVGLVMSLAILRDGGEPETGELAVAESTGTSRQAIASLASGDVCSGGLVATEGERGTFALSCESGTIWLGDYIFFTDDLGGAQIRDQSGAPGRMIYGPDVPQSGLGAAEFENLWSAREAMGGS
jgi:hypothetical protein